MFKKTLAFVGILSTSVIFANTQYNSYQGQYVSFGAGATYANKIYDTGGSDCGILGVGGVVFLGDQFTKYFAPEFETGYDSFGSGGLTTLSVDGRFTFPVGQRFSIFARLGGGYAEAVTRITTRVQKNSFVPTMGLGVGYGLTNKWAMSLETDGAWLPQSLGNANGYAGAITVNFTRYWF